MAHSRAPIAEPITSEMVNQKSNERITIYNQLHCAKVHYISGKAHAHTNTYIV